MVVYYDSSDSESEARHSAGSGSISDFGKTSSHSSSRSARKLLASRAKLPMYRARKAALAELANSPVLVLVGSTGSGKSTQLPQLIADANPRARIAVTQPRRVAAVSLARRVAQESGTELGAKVGFAVRFNACVGPETMIKYVTDGMLLREFAADSELRRYTHVIIDEAHERTVTTDLLLGLLKQLRERRPRLRIVVMSATLDAQRFAGFFGSDAHVVGVPGRLFPVEQLFLSEPVGDVVAAAVETVRRINRSEPLPGDVLVFLPGQEEIVAALEMLQAAVATEAATDSAVRDKSNKKDPREPGMLVVPLYASLPEHLQQKAFAAPKRHTRKIVLATNIAETSLTIAGVRYVVDSGLRKVRVYRPRLGLDSLLPAPISKASAAQRAGRAGREAPGKCWRLYTSKAYDEMAEHTEPEIKRVSVATPVLALKVAGIDDIVSFPWLDPPAEGAIAAALFQLFALRALDDNGRITKLGRSMAALPVDPALAAVLVATRQQKSKALCEAVIDVVACLCVPELLQTPPTSRRAQVNAARGEAFPAASQHGDLYLLRAVLDTARSMPSAERKGWCRDLAISARALSQTGQVRQQLRRYLGLLPSGSSSSESEVAGDDDAESEAAAVLPDDINRAFLAGYAASTAVGLPDRRYQTIANAQTLSIHPSSTLFGRRVPAIMYLEYVFTTKGYARMVAPIELDWLREAAPHLVSRAASELTSV